MRRTIAVLFCATLAMAVGAVAAPPPGLSPYGKIAWNFEALARSYYGTAEVCADSRTTARNYTARTCASVPEADQYVYEPVFAVPTQSAFKLTRRSPSQKAIGNVQPLELGGYHVLCRSGSWLAENSFGGWICT